MSNGSSDWWTGWRLDRHLHHAQRAEVRTDPDPEVKRHAVFWLSQVGTDRAVNALDSILRFSKDPDIQDNAVFALSQHASAKAQQARQVAARDRPGAGAGHRNAEAGVVLGRPGRRPHRGTHRVLCHRGRSGHAGAARLRYSQRSEPAALEKLIEITRRDPNPELPKRALFWLGQSEDPGAVAALQEIIEQP
ncbi:MAG: HEAT repeat domain-containing protein [Gemmatimonadales bacterium]